MGTVGVETGMGTMGVGTGVPGVTVTGQGYAVTTPVVAMLAETAREAS